jgi:glycosyltransferase involved in cell wall biosynthesis
MGPKNNKKLPKYPFVSICTPTFNRRPFIPIIIKCFENQDYPKDKMEWIIVDDGTDKIEDLVAHIPQVKYFKYDEKMTVGKKRNITNSKAKGSIIVYMDDDDYYPSNRVSHAVEKLQGSPALCAGSSEMFIYFKHISKMYKFGPYGPNHSTAATFAFKRELLQKTKFDETSAVAEEKKFLKDYTIPFVQLDSNKTILVFSHTQNSFDKKELLKQGPNPNMAESLLTPDYFVKEPDMLKFFMEDINNLLDNYSPGDVKFKPDVVKQLADLAAQREKMMQEHIQKQSAQNIINELNKVIQQKTTEIDQLKGTVQQKVLENDQLKEQIKYVNDKIKQLIAEKIQDKKKAVL